MNSIENILFTPFKLGPITLRNRTIRAAAFEGMYPGNKVKGAVPGLRKLADAVYKEGATCSIQIGHCSNPVIATCIKWKTSPNML